MKILCIFFGIITKLDYLEVISMHFRVFSYGQGTEWGIFLGVAKINFCYHSTGKRLDFYIWAIVLFLFVKRLLSNLNIMSLVAVKKRKSWEK